MLMAPLIWVEWVTKSEISRNNTEISIDSSVEIFFVILFFVLNLKK